jgi:predicted nucleic acid-binding protein
VTRKAGYTLDAGALIAIERGSSTLRAVLEHAVARDRDIAIPAGVVGQVWRGGAGQARLAGFLRRHRHEVVPLDDRLTRLAGELCGVSRTSDVIDATVVLCAWERRHLVVTSDPDDIHALDPALAVYVV